MNRVLKPPHGGLALILHRIPIVVELEEHPARPGRGEGRSGSHMDCAVCMYMWWLQRGVRACAAGWGKWKQASIYMCEESCSTRHEHEDGGRWEVAGGQKELASGPKYFGLTG